MKESRPSNGKGALIFSSVVLRTIRVDPRTRLTVMRKVLACLIYSASKKPNMVRYWSTKTVSAAREQADIAATVRIMKMNATQNALTPSNLESGSGVA